MSSDDSDAEPYHKRKRKVRRLEDSPDSISSSGSPIIGSSSLRRGSLRSRNPIRDSSNSESDSGSPIRTHNKRKKPRRVASDSESESSGSIIIKRTKKAGRIASDSDTDSDVSDRGFEGSSSSQWETDVSDTDMDSKVKPDLAPAKTNIDSDSSDGQSEKCPICLIRFKSQEIGTPESCDHVFCLECIQEWSKNMNTCPVDRQEYNLILVRKDINGKVIRQVPIEKPTPQIDVDIVEDPTFCEMCGSSDNEDQMLLCDGCDLGFHLYCLTPPLDEVPSGAWYCTGCSSHDEGDSDIELVGIALLFDDFTGPRRRRSRLARLVPRTRISERVRRRIANNRQRNHLREAPSTSTGSGNHRVTDSVSSSTPKRNRSSKHKQYKKKTKRQVRYKTVYEIDEATGETVAVKKRQSKPRKSKRKTVKHSSARPKTVKKRLAAQLGICVPRTASQSLSDIKVQGSSNPNNLGGLRYQAGIPTLHLFGASNELDYFSGEEDESYVAGSGILSARAPTRSDVSAMRRMARRKAAISFPSAVSSSTDLLDSILTSQEQFHSRNSAFSVDSSGKFRVEQRKSRGEYVDVNRQRAVTRQAPNNYRRGTGNPNHNYNRSNSNSYHSHGHYQYHSVPTSTMESASTSHFDGNDLNELPQDYTQRTLCASSEGNTQERRDRDEDNTGTNTPNSESEIDIYSDIETVSTSKIDDNDLRPPSPSRVSNVYTPTAGTDEDNNDSEPDMVIDDEKVQEMDRSQGDQKEEAAVSSTVGFSNEFVPSALECALEMPHSSMEIQSEAIQSSNLSDHRNIEEDDEWTMDGCPNTSIYSKESIDALKEIEEVDSDDGCPNFSIYSKESKTVALHTDISLTAEDNLTVHQDYQVGEVSSSPNLLGMQRNLPVQENFCEDGDYDFNNEGAISFDDAAASTQNYYEGTSFEDGPANNEGATSPKEGNAKGQSDLENEDEIEDGAAHAEKTTCDNGANVQNSNEEAASFDEGGTKVEDSQEATSSSAQNEVPHEGDECENITYDFEKESPFPQENSEENVTYEFEKVPDEAATSDVPVENVTYDFEKFDEQQKPDIGEHSNPPAPARGGTVGVVQKLISGGILGGLYSDSEDESVVNKGSNSFAFSDINQMTEDISEDERSYTPCLDERGHRQGLDGLDTELISDEDRNDFDESHELKTVSDGDALEINAKESELDFTRPEDYEEGEIVDKNKVAKHPEESEKEAKKVKAKSSDEDGKGNKKLKKGEKDKPIGESDKGGNKENEGHNKESSFKKLSKNTKERNYRDKDKDVVRPNSPSKDRLLNRKEKRREKRKELERYNVRAIIAEKPRPLIIKDQFGRDIRRTPSRSKSRSNTPPIQESPPKTRISPVRHRHISASRRRSRSLSRPRSSSRKRKTPSKERSRKRRARSRHRSMSSSKKRSGSKSKKRKRSSSRYKRRKSRDRSKKKPRTRSRHRSRSLSRRNREYSNRRAWTPISMSLNQEVGHMSPSWTPPRMIDTSHLLTSETLAAAVSSNLVNKKKKEKKRKSEKRNKESNAMRQKKKRREADSSHLSKEVFSSGENILVSISFANDSEKRDVTTREVTTREVTTRERRKKEMEEMNKKKKEKRRSKNRKDLSGVKPVAIIDLELSPFEEIMPSPKDVIVLTDSDNNDNEEASGNVENAICDSSQQVASPEPSISYPMGPKTPPEPQIKFSLSAKTPQVRSINNPLHDPDDIENNEEVQEEIDSRINENLQHKGPNTPPEPPNSPPSSPDAYDPFEPTKSRSPTPEPLQTGQSNVSLSESTLESRAAIELLEKSINPTNPELIKSLTPPIADVQPADSQSSIPVTPESNVGKSPERISVVINQTVQPSVSTSKPVAQTTPFSSVPTSLITSTPVSSSLAPPRINILNSTIITTPTVASSLPQRIILPNQVKSSPVKISPTKAAIKSTPIKPMLSKNNKAPAGRKGWPQNGSGVEELDLDSPYSPGSSDYEDLFEPPPENAVKPAPKTSSKSTAKSPQKHQSVFDTLFGSPSYNKSKNRNDKGKFGRKSTTPSKTKTVGVKLDEDNLRILDEVPNSAVELIVKDKFLKKLNRQERVVEEVKLVLKPHYNKKRITKEEYKDILRRSVPKICHNKSGEINPTKIKNLIEAYVKKVKHSKKVTSSSSVNPQKV